MASSDDEISEFIDSVANEQNEMEAAAEASDSDSAPIVLSATTSEERKDEQAQFRTLTEIITVILAFIKILKITVILPDVDYTL